MSEPIKWDGTPYQAAVICSTLVDEAGAWTLHLINEDGLMTNAIAKWDISPMPIPLASRYDVLALSGFAVVTPGAEAWQWQEQNGEDDYSYFIGTCPVRPLRDDERADAVATALERTPLHYT